MSTSNFDISKLNLQVIDISMNMSPDIFINLSGITFTKKALEELNYPAYVQYAIDVENKVFAVKACRSTDKGAAPFSKPRGEQTITLSCGNKNVLEPIREVLKTILRESKRYKVTGFMLDNKTMIFVLPEGAEQAFREQKENAADLD